jgi:peptide/nickel transport system substrate-binding protein
MRLAAAATAVILAVALAAAAPVAGQQPKRGGTAVFVIDTDPPTLNPATTTGATDEIVGIPLNAQLLMVDSDESVHPLVAESWSVAADGRTVTFRIRRNVKFHDGTPLGSADVKFTFEEVLAKYHPQASRAFAHVASVETLDPYTVVVHFKEPYGPFLFLIGLNGTVLPRHLYEGTDVLKNPHNLQPVGAGPYRLQEWARGDHITVVRNDAYFEPGLPYLDRIVYKMIPDPHARTIAVETGEADYIHDYYFNRADYAQVAHRKDLVARVDPGLPEDDLIIFNVRRAPLSDRRVRQAIARALDRKLLIDRAYRGLGGVAHSAIDSRIAWAYNPQVDYEKMYAYDPRASEALLDEAGYPRRAGGTRFAMRLTFDPRHVGFLDMAQILRESLRRVGIDVQLEAVERNVMISKVFMNWDFDATLQNYATAGDPAVGIQRAYVCADVRKAPFVNASGYCNAEVDALFAEGAAQTTTARRAAAYRKVQALLAQDIPTFPIVQIAEVDVARATVRGLWQNGSASYYYARIWQQP